MRPEVSIIIPIFNPTPSLLRRSVASALSQTFGDIELILVDDGSDPAVGREIDELARDDERTRVVHQENHGVSSARNRGLGEALGRHVAFLDADDYLHPGFVSSALEALKCDAVDVALGKIEVKTSDGEALWRVLPTDQGHQVLLRPDDVEGALAKVFSSVPSFFGDYGIDTFPNVVAALYSRRVLDAVRFPEGVRHGEDRVFNYGVLARARGVVVVDEVWYTYDRTHESGATQTLHPARVPDLCATIEAFAAAVDGTAGGAAGSPRSVIKSGAALGILSYVKLGALVCASGPMASGLAGLRMLVDATASSGAPAWLSGVGLADAAVGRIVKWRLSALLLILAKARLIALGRGADVLAR